MTGDQIRTMFSTIVDDDMDDVQAYIFMNAAKNEIESYRDWNFNRAVDSSNTVQAGTNYLSTITLPTGLLSPRAVFFRGDRNPLVLISFEERERYQDAYKRYYIDWLNRTFSICGASGAAGKTIDFFYARQTNDITDATSPVWPSAFHPLLGFKMAEMWMSSSDNDLENVSEKASRENLRLYTNLLKSMIAWDAKIKTLEYNARNVANVDPTSYPNVVDLN